MPFYLLGFEELTKNIKLHKLHSDKKPPLPAQLKELN